MNENIVNDFFDKSGIALKKMISLEKKNNILSDGIIYALNIYNKLLKSFDENNKNIENPSIEECNSFNKQFEILKKISSKRKKNLFYKLNNYVDKSKKISNIIKSLKAGFSDFDSEYKHLLNKMNEFIDSFPKFEEEYNYVLKKLQK